MHEILVWVLDVQLVRRIVKRLIGVESRFLRLGDKLSSQPRCRWRLLRVTQQTSSPLLDSITSSSMVILRSLCIRFRQSSLRGNCCAGVLTFELTLTDEPPGLEIEYFRVLRPPGAVKLSPTERFREFNPSSSFRPLPRNGLRELSIARRLLV